MLSALSDHVGEFFMALLYLRISISPNSMLGLELTHNTILVITESIFADLVINSN